MVSSTQLQTTDAGEVQTGILDPAVAKSVAKRRAIIKSRVRPLLQMAWNWGTFIMPIWFVVYSSVAMHSHFSVVGGIDALSFVAIICLTFYTILRTSSRVARMGLAYFFTSLLILLFVGNVAYFRFFNAWMDADIVTEWGVGMAVADVVLGLLHSGDWGFGVAIPLVIATIMGFWKSEVRVKSAASIYGVVLIICVPAHSILHSPTFVPSENNIGMYLLRGWSAPYTSASDNHSRFVGLRDQIGTLFATPTGYRREENDCPIAEAKFPLINVPIEGEAPAPLVSFDPKRPPNIVLVLMESVRSYESGAYGASPSFTPNLDRLAGEGVLFKNFYANATRTVQGELAILCSYYPNDGGTIYSHHPNLRLSSLPEILGRKGYDTLWIHSYTAKFMNKGKFLRRHGINHIYDGSSMKADCPTIGWGPSDEALFEHAENILDQQDQQQGPFFAQITTLSNHAKWEGPYPTANETPFVENNTRYSDYTKGIYYTDSAIGGFMKRMRKKPYFENTIFVFCGDHGMWQFPASSKLSQLQRQEAHFRIPCIFYAPKLLDSQVVDVVGSQVDVAPTLLQILGIRARNSFVGCSLFEKSPSRPRFALFRKPGTWSIRTGNQYIYESVAEEHASGRRLIQDRLSDNHVLIESDADLLRLASTKQLSHGSEQDRRRLIQWGNDLVFLNKALLLSNVVYDRIGNPNRTATASINKKRKF